MKKTLFVSICVAFGILNSLLFYNQQWGLNLALFEIPLAILLIAFNKSVFKGPTPVFIVAGWLASMASVVVAHTHLSITLHICFFILLGGLTLQPIKNPVYSFLGFFEKLPLIIELFLKNETGTVTKKRYTTGYVFRLSIIPVLIIILFTLLYSMAVPRFSILLQDFFSLFPELNMQTVLLFSSGFLVALYTLYIVKNNYFSGVDAASHNTLFRKRLKQVSSTLKLGLKKEHLSILMLLAGLNLLIALVNVLDIASYWFSYNPVSYEDMKVLVHEGTTLLIFCILLSIGIVLYAFRKNLNFYSKNKWVKYLGIAWLAQNGLMVISVAWRNYWYIQSFNLAYKRIAVFAFLAVALFGIITAIIKINRRKSMYYLLRTNSSFVLILLLPLAFVRWDVFVARYNLQHKDTAYIHKNFLVSMDNAALPVLLEYEKVFDKHLHLESETEYRSLLSTYGDTSTFAQVLHIKKERFLAEYKNRHWLSFNLPDYQAALKLQTLKN